MGFCGDTDVVGVPPGERTVSLWVVIGPRTFGIITRCWEVAFQVVANCDHPIGEAQIDRIASPLSSF